MIDEFLRESSVAEAFHDEGVRDSVRTILETRFGSLDEPLLAAIQ